MTTVEKFTHAARRVSRGLVRLEREQVCCSDVTLQQFDTLRLLRGPGASIGTLAAELGIDLSTASRNLAVLERGGYVRRERARDDARQVSCRLTAKGERCVDSLTCDARMVFGTVLARIPAAERARVTDALSVLADALESQPATVQCAPRATHGKGTSR